MINPSHQLNTTPSRTTVYKPHTQHHYNTSQLNPQILPTHIMLYIKTTILTSIVDCFVVCFVFFFASSLLSFSSAIQQQHSAQQCKPCNAVGVLPTTTLPLWKVKSNTHVLTLLRKQTRNGSQMTTRSST